MNTSVKYIAQLCNDETGEVIKEEVLKTKLVVFPKTLNEFGLRHKEQIELIKCSQDFLIKVQSKFFEDQKKCPQCGKNTRKQGEIESEFHDVCTDHKIIIQRLTCTCGWKNKYTINGIYGNASHPELVKLQTTTGSNNSFEKTSKILEAFSCGQRSINNNVTIMRNVNKVGKLLEQHKKSANWMNSLNQAKELIIVTDGGHVQDKAANHHSFEEMISTIYNPDDVVFVGPERKEIKRKTCVGSAKKDGQRSIKVLTKNACKKMGMDLNTQITALTDGAANCWSVINSLSHECKGILKILDWFHIGKKFKERESKIPEAYKEKYEKAKWHLWHGHRETAIIRIEQIKKELLDKVSIEKLNELISYINNNKDCIVNYHARKLKNLSYSSQLGESSVNTVINDRQKNKKMQWTRDGAHSVLQIRTSIFSKNWEQDWGAVESMLYRKAA